MNYIKRGKLLAHDWYFRIGQRVQVEGINSQLNEYESVLFWEFDGMGIATVEDALLKVQYEYGLPTIYILQASTDTSWHAVCLGASDWLQCLSIVAGTPFVDPDYVRLAAMRKHFTLRLTDKGQGAPKPVKALWSCIPADAVVGDFIQGVRYGAWRRETV